MESEIHCENCKKNNYPCTFCMPGSESPEMVSVSKHDLTDLTRQADRMYQMSVVAGASQFDLCEIHKCIEKVRAVLIRDNLKDI